MVLSVTDNWRREMARPGVQPVIRAVITVGPAIFLTVVNYTAGAGDSITVSITWNLQGGGTTTQSATFVEGTAWHAATDNATTALSIAHAISGTTVTGPNTYVNVTRAVQVLAYAYSNVVVIVPSPPFQNTNLVGALISVASMTVTFGSIAFTQRFLPESFAFSSEDYVGRPASEFPIVADVGQVRNSMDPVTRKVSIGSIDLVLSEATGAARALLSSCLPHNRRVQLSLGATTLGVSDFAPVGLYLIDEMIPQPGAITLRCVEPIILAQEAQVTGNFFGMHPVDVIKTLLPMVGFPYAFFDLTSLDLSQPVFADIGHWSVTRNNFYGTIPGAVLSDGTFNHFPNCNNGIGQPTPVKQIIDELSTLCNASFRISEAGVYAFARYVSTVASSRVLGDDQITQFEQVHTLDNQISRVQIIGTQAVNAIAGPLSVQSQSGMVLADLSDYVASAAYTSGQIVAQKTYQIQTEWLGVPAFLYYQLNADAAHNPQPTFTTFSTSGDTQANNSANQMLLQPATIAGFCGTVPGGLLPCALQQPNGGLPTAPVTINSYQQLDGVTRTSYILLTDGSDQEIIACSGSFSPPYRMLQHGGAAFEANAVALNVDFVRPSSYLSAGLTYQNNIFSPSVGSPIPHADASWSSFFSNLTGFAMWSVGGFAIQQRDVLGGGANPRTWYTSGGLSLLSAYGGIGTWPTNATRAFDVTIARFLAQALFSRFRLGAPVVRVRVPLVDWDLQIGDFVTLVNDLYLSTFTAAATGQAVFEVTGKELCIFDDSPGVILELTWARDNVTPEVASYSGQSGGAMAPSPQGQTVVTDSGGNVVTTSAGIAVTT